MDLKKIKDSPIQRRYSRFQRNLKALVLLAGFLYVTTGLIFLVFILPVLLVGKFYHWMLWIGSMLILVNVANRISRKTSRLSGLSDAARPRYIRYIEYLDTLPFAVSDPLKAGYRRSHKLKRFQAEKPEEKEIPASVPQSKPPALNIKTGTRPRPPYSNDESEESRQKLVDYYNSLGWGKLEVIKINLMLDPGEKAYYEAQALNIRGESVRKNGVTWEIQNTFHYTGNSLLLKLLLNKPLIEGVLIDEGILVITSRRMIFAGDKTAFSFTLDAIINAKASGNIIQIFPDGSPSVHFAVDDILLFLKILEGAKRKSKLSERNLQ